MTKQELLALADRVEALQGADREIDAEIACAIKFPKLRPVRPDDFDGKYGYSAGNIKVDTGFMMAHSYTASIDAALSLVPEMWVVASLEWWPCTKRASVTLREVRKNDWGVGYDQTCGDGRSEASLPALAITAASLRAKASRL